MFNKKSFKIMVFFLLILPVLFFLSCSSGGGGGSSSGTPATGTGGVQLSGTIQPDPTDGTANGKQSGATVYVIGQESNSVQTDSNGNFTLSVDPQLSSTVLASASLKNVIKFSSIQKVPTGTQTITYGLVVANPGTDPTHGKKTEVTIVTDQTNTCPTIYIDTVGSISGHAYLQNQTDHSGITVYIPGTSFSAITAADGSYSISHVPSGTYDYLRAEKFGTTYHYAILSGVTVNSNQNTAVADMLLQLSTGPFGSILINNGAAFTNSATVNLAIAPSADAILMSISSDPSFVGAAWEPVQATKQFTFPAPYPGGGQTVNAYIKFAQESGLASSPTMTSIYLDTNPQATKLAPVSVTMSQTPTLQWSYTPPMPNPEYHVQLASDSGFTNPIVDVTGLTANQYAVPVADTLAEGIYYWRVAIIYNGAELGWGPMWSFAVDRTAGTLLSPANGSKTSNQTPSFTWNPNSSAVSYRFTLSTNADLSSPVIDVLGVTGNSYGPVSQLAPAANTIYFWAITPYDSLSNPGTRSDIWTFTLDTVAPTGMPVSLPTGTGITINNNDIFAANTRVTLNLAASDPDNVVAYLVSQTSNPPSSNDLRWVVVTPTSTLNINTSFTVTSGTGSKTVYAWFKDSVGNISSTYSDTINLLDFSSNTQTVDDAGLYGFPSVAYNPCSGVNIIYADQLNNGVKYTTDYGGSWAWPTYLDSSTAAWAGSDHSLALHYYGWQYDLQAVYVHGYVPEYVSKAGVLRSQWSSPVEIDPAAASTNSGAQQPSIAVDSTNKANIAYIGNNKLKYATIDPSVGLASLTTTTLDSSGTGTVYGQSLSIALDSSDHVYISYYDRTNDQLKVITNASGLWVPTVIDSGIGGTGTYKITYTSIAVSNNIVHVAYYDSTHSVVKYASNASGSWASGTALPGTHSGLNFISIAVDAVTSDAFVAYTTIAGLTVATNKYGQWAAAVIDSNVTSSYLSATSFAPDGHCVGSKSINVVYVDNNHGYVLKYSYATY